MDPDDLGAKQFQSTLSMRRATLSTIAASNGGS